MNNAIKVARENLNNFYDQFYKVYLNRYVYYEIPKGKMPELLRYLDKIGFVFKPDSGELKKLLGNYKGLEEEYNELVKLYDEAQDDEIQKTK
jgi:hypothetical protein